MSGKSFATQCPHCHNYGNHDCCTQDKWLLKLYPLSPSFIIEDIVINLREYEQKEVYYTLHQRKCSHCDRNFVSTEIAENFLRSLLDKAEALKETNSENEKLENGIAVL